MRAEAAPRAPEKPKAPEAQRPAQARRAEGERTEKSEKSEKVAESANEDQDEDDAASSDQDAAASAQAAAAALALATAGLLGPAAAKVVAAVKTAADGKAVAGVDGAADGQTAGADAWLADGTGRAPAAGPAADAARAALADGQSGVAKLASYASVLEQLQSRLAKGEKGDVSGADRALPGTGADPGAAAAKAASGVALQNTRTDKLMNALQAGSGMGQAVGSETTKLASLSLEAGEALKAIDRFRGEAPRDSAGTTPDGAPGQQSFTSTVQFDGTTGPATTVSGPAAGDAVADQVSQWVSQGIHSAELTLDGANAERVEVKISMSGNEAHVEFRSDQPATREMLAGTASQLRDLLSGQGVVLSGVTVGHAGADLAGGQQQQSRPRGERGPAREASLAPQAVSAARPAAASSPAGALDLFV
ncbi:hypothetical protein RD110_05070 [Rhodoferax koreense]|uniref:Flagellar hook-length control protein-like C-terminal domain-containing protein n=1 Tax=Rhodoferax koreensis TaxID=1842727 RepID=A0A1P8JSE7_9BURK|nr:flagellar hook-length control protein FliK [Rhodoferax koreense]APW36648.1 hypothetical protein RD110_05070 [Rhodoferax koreense]